MNKKIKILHIITGLKTGGAEIFVRDLINNMDKNFFDVSVLSLTPIGNVGEEICENRMRVYCIGSKFKFNPLLFLRLFVFLKKHKPNVVHTHLFHADILSRIVLIFFRKIKLVSTFHSTESGGKFRDLCLRITKFIPDRTVAVSEAVKKEGEKRKILVKNTSVIYGGIDIKNFNKSYDKKKLRKKLNLLDNFLFICVGRLNKSKGYDVLIKSVADLNEKKINFSVLILGEGEERGNLEIMIKEKGINNIYLVGNVDNVNEFLGASDVFLIMSRWEGLSLSLIEATVVGLPVIATRVGGIPEVLKNKKNSILIEPNNWKNLSDSMFNLINMKKENLLDIDERGKNYVRKKFSIINTVDNYSSVYQDLIFNRTSF